MVDPKMLELSVYDGIPHLLTPVVTDPKKAVVALKWAVREMEDRYKKMSKLGVRNIDGFNARVTEAAAKGEVITRTVQTGFDRETGEAVYEQEQMDLSTLPYIVVIVDEMADLMMVAGKEIEGAIQRLAQMARAAGIHLIMATQRPSVDVITGTIKANFPTRVSFQVTSKIDSRTILGEMGAEQLLGQGDMLYMAGGGRIVRVHGPFVSDAEVERVVAHLKTQGQPDYLDGVTAEDDGEDEDAAPLPLGDDDGRRSLRPRRGRGAARQEVLDVLCPAPLAGRLQQGGLAGGAHGEGGGRRPRQPCRKTPDSRRRRHGIASLLPPQTKFYSPGVGVSLFHNPARPSASAEPATRSKVRYMKLSNAHFLVRTDAVVGRAAGSAQSVKASERQSPNAEPAQRRGKQDREARGRAGREKSKSPSQSAGRDPDVAIQKAKAYLNPRSSCLRISSRSGGWPTRRGQALRQRPGRLRFEYAQPATIEIIADGTSVSIRDRKLATQDLYFISQTPLKFLLKDMIASRKDVKIPTCDRKARS